MKLTKLFLCTWTLFTLEFQSLAANEGISEPVIVTDIEEGILTISETSLGPVLADPSGISLYTFDLDDEGVSNCSGRCLEIWPPYLVAEDVQVFEPYSVITLADGSRQLAVQGLALYYYFRDSEPGDVFGQYPEWRVVPACELDTTNDLGQCLQ